MNFKNNNPGRDMKTYELYLKSRSNHNYELEGVFDSIDEIASYLDMPKAMCKKILTPQNEDDINPFARYKIVEVKETVNNLTRLPA